jgi:glutathione S-transferase
LNEKGKMRKLYHYWLSPASRQVRLCLSEKSLSFDLILEKPWERRAEFINLNPTGDLPVLVESEGDVIAEVNPICEYLDEVYPDRPLLGRDPITRAEVRRLVGWFNQKFYHEVSVNLLEEKTFKAYYGRGAPSSSALRAGAINLNNHLAYISYLVERRNWLAGDRFSLADICAASHLSSIDYLGDISWDKHPEAKDWYAKIKSRPSFRPLLHEVVPGILPSRHYVNLDF